MWKNKEFTDIAQDVLTGREDVNIEKKTIEVKVKKFQNISTKRLQ